MELLGWRGVNSSARHVAELYLPINDRGTKTMSVFIHDPSNRCLVDWRGLNLLDLDPPGPVEGRRLVVSVGGILRIGVSLAARLMVVSSVPLLKKVIVMKQGRKVVTLSECGN